MIPLSITIGPLTVVHLAFRSSEATCSQRSGGIKSSLITWNADPLSTIISSAIIDVIGLAKHLIIETLFNLADIFSAW